MADELDAIPIELLEEEARKMGVVLWLDTDGYLKAYPKSCKNIERIEMLLRGRHVELKALFIKRIYGEGQNV